MDKTENTNLQLFKNNQTHFCEINSGFVDSGLVVDKILFYRILGI
jgi:hypothetical protein